MCCLHDIRSNIVIRKKVTSTYLASDLTIHTGKVVNQLQRLENEGEGNEVFLDHIVTDLEKNVGDLMISLLVLSKVYDIDLHDVLIRQLSRFEKLRETEGNMNLNLLYLFDKVFIEEGLSCDSIMENNDFIVFEKGEQRLYILFDDILSHVYNKGGGKNIMEYVRYIRSQVDDTKIKEIIDYEIEEKEIIPMVFCVENMEQEDLDLFDMDEFTTIVRRKQ